MANVKITDLVAGTALGGTELFESVQSAASVKITASQIKTFASDSPTITGGVFSSPTITGGVFSSPTITGGVFSSPTITGGVFSSPTITGGVFNSVTISNAVGEFDSITITAGAVPFNTITNRAYAQFESHADQSATSANVAYVVQMDDAAPFNAGITIASSTNVTVAAAGVYSINASIQFANAAAADHNATFWYRRNGSNIAHSASVISVPKVADGGKTLAQVTIFESLSVSDYVQLVWSPDNINVTLDYTAASGVIPEVPSVIFNMTRIA